ncbi:phasin family protein [Chitinimonas sp. BJB300]|uniref:phasin family protein n=1 Tax=Chitinimonas sp. BJB300 TaxID=1559339 RepID=UPI000C0E8DD5|nr:phasin family protein [Chitinimonas sp. BJB300]PHV11217.1 phasin [Chitinimonas sp. BJB300]TSJ87376.1 phasin family protein [Chitinimonas sp. BJB300]
MFATTDFAALGQAQVEKSIRLSNIALAGAERFFALQLDVARDLIANNTATVKAFSEVKDVQGLIALQQQISQPAVDKALAVAKHVYEATSSAQAELGAFVEEQVVEFNRNLVSNLDKAVKQAPAGSEIMVSAVKTAVATAASAYDTVARTAKKVTSDFADAGVAAAESSAKAAASVSKNAMRKNPPNIAV